MPPLNTSTVHGHTAVARVGSPPETVAGAPATDDEFIRQLSDRFGSGLFYFVLGLTKDRDWAEDIVQMTLIRAWRSRDRLVEAGDSARGWLYTVARRIFIDDCRARSARPVVLTGDLRAAAPADEIGLLVLKLAVDQALSRLTEANRRAVISVLQQNTIAETAKLLGISEGTVKSRTHYGIRALRKALADLPRARPATAA